MYPDRAGDVFELLFPGVLKIHIELIPNLPEGIIGDADAARLSNAFQSRSDVDAIAKISPSSTRMSPTWIPIRTSMRWSRATPSLRTIPRCTWIAHRAASTMSAELDRNSIAGSFDNATTVRCNRRFQEFMAVGVLVERGFPPHRPPSSGCIRRLLRRGPPQVAALHDIRPFRAPLNS